MNKHMDWMSRTAVRAQTRRCEAKSETSGIRLLVNWTHDRSPARLGLAVEAAGAEPLRGGLADLDILRTGAAERGAAAVVLGRPAPLDSPTTMSAIRGWVVRSALDCETGRRDQRQIGMRAADDGCMIGDRWGVTDGEISCSYPCDNFVVSPALQAWRGVRVEAPSEAVWPWVAQVRLAPYSYDWIDNRGRRSPQELVGLTEPQVGERFTTAGGRRLGRIVSVDPGIQLTGTIMGAFMSYVLTSQEHDTTRLLLKVVMQTTRWAALGLSVGDLIMARRQLLNLKHLAERHYQGTATD
jgi:hypothetical protein